LDSPMMRGMNMMGNIMGNEPLPLLSPASSVGDFSGCGLSPSVLRSLQESSPMGFRTQVGQEATSPTKTFGGEPTSVGRLMEAADSIINSDFGMDNDKLELDLEPMNDSDSSSHEDAATPPLMMSHPASTTTTSSPSAADRGTLEQFTSVAQTTAPVVLLPPPPQNSSSSSCCSPSSSTVLHVNVCKLNEPPPQFAGNNENSWSCNSNDSSIDASIAGGYSATVCFSEGGQKRSRGGRMTPVDVAFSPSVLPTHKKAYQGEDRMTSADTAGMAGRLRKQNNNSRAIYSATIAP